MGKGKKKREKGLFASQIIRTGEVVAEFNGTMVLAPDDKHRGYMLQYNQQFILDCYDNAKSGKCIASMANHSDIAAERNSEIAIDTKHRKIRLKATRTIKNGEEILYAYGQAFQEFGFK